MQERNFVQAGDTIGHAITALQFMERELLLFATFWFIIGALDDLAIDVCWLWLRLTGRSPALGISRAEVAGRLEGRIAVLIAAWQEGAVIGHTIRHALGAWPQPELTLYLGCYRNDPGTIAAAMAAAGNDPRLRIVIHERAGPTTKADCLNRLYRALAEDERRTDQRFRTVVIHDAEDMVHPAELAVIDRAIGSAGLVQLPVRPEPQPRSPWIGGHYCEEFTEAHAKLLVVRDALRVPVPAAGVGCGIARDLLDLLAARRLREGEGDGGPFSTTCLTEDYELGYLVWREGRRTRFIRVRDEDGELVATRAYFPASLEAAVRQKARWIHGIAFQEWERLGWGTRLADLWMTLRDRREPFSALVLASGYVLVLVELLLALARLAQIDIPPRPSPALQVMLGICAGALVWRAAARFAFTTHEYGPGEGLRALLRIPVANVIAIIAGRRALATYVRTLLGETVRWDKTEHTRHPAADGLAMLPSGGAR
ncbi:hypothetical protein GCM10011614_21980 [Novosphingobium colocasiae]|uniref:Glycosyl transferase family protein n=1 Tax=Novosphingobium colocasiae TaxID=1256513 RepID=A0A918PFS3_9SPHN|nr:hypothetical protein GCM10011614_21980 [Novosphingobium colocasiae]